MPGTKQKEAINPERDWTIMVYLAGDNNLSSECAYAINEMKKVKGLDQFYLLVQFDPDDAIVPTHRYLIEGNGDVTTLLADIIDLARYNPRTGEVHFRHESSRANRLATTRLAERVRVCNSMPAEARRATLGTGPDLTDGSNDDTDTASPITLYNFLSYGLSKYPAKHYMAVVAGHGAGTQRDFFLKDMTPSGYLTLNELKTVLKEIRYERGRPLDILGLDNCLMSMAEVSYELRGTVDYVVGCEGFSPAAGWPFREVLERLRDERTKVSKESVPVRFSKAIVEEYTKYYANSWLGGVSVAQSAMDMSKVDALKQAVAGLGEALVAELRAESKRKRTKGALPGHYPFRDNLILAHWETQSFNGERFVDLFDFCACLRNRHAGRKVQAQCKLVQKAITNYVMKSCYSGPTFQYAFGVSVYFPWSQVVNSYVNLDFVKGSGRRMGGWGKFLAYYTEITRRPPRDLVKAPGLAKFSHGTSIIRRLVRKTSDMKTSDMKTSDMGGNDILSMRNPPVVFVPSECVEPAQRTLDAEERLIISPGRLKQFKLKDIGAKEYEKDKSRTDRQDKQDS